MRTDSGKTVQIIKNADVREEFEKVVTDPKLISFWTNYVREKICYSIIGRHDKECSAGDILSELKLKIYAKNLEWDRENYPLFVDFMYGQIQNIMRNIELHLLCIYENNLNEVGQESLLNVKPKPEFTNSEIILELNTDLIGKELLVKEDKFAYYSGTLKGQFDPDKFNSTVLVILKDVKDTDLLAVYNGFIEKKKSLEIRTEYGMSEKEYEKTWKRLLYKLKRELPPMYRNMLSTTMIAHLIMHQVMR
jgi:hypothetical protein